jgi:predicted TIM-barrel fold metal-dependent hydrolase
MTTRHPHAPGGGEEALEPALPICDAHHHLWPVPVWEHDYLLDDLLEDTASGHDVKSSVYVECQQSYYESGPDRFRPVGETEFAAKCAETSAERGGTEIVGIIGYADLRDGEQVRDVLNRHIEAGRGRFRGIRHATAWDADPLIGASHVGSTENLMGESAFREGLGVLAEMDLVFDAWLYHRQLPELTEAARAVPALTIVVDHLGGPLGIGSYADNDSVLPEWKKGIEGLAACPNVSMKLGGIGMPLIEHAWPERPAVLSSSDVVAQWRERIDFCIDSFGADRCMFESNFPVDRERFSYVVLWNAFKLMTRDRSPSDRDWLFRDTAVRVYDLPASS